MELFRISAALHAEKLKASGMPNRWNVRGQRVIYAGTHRSLATLELLVHRSAVELLRDFRVMVIHVPDDDRFIRQVMTRELPVNWRTTAAYGSLQKIGSDWYQQQETLLLRVPSAVIPQEYNIVINTEHPEFSRQVKLIRSEPYFWDERLK